MNSQCRNLLGAPHDRNCRCEPCASRRKNNEEQMKKLARTLKPSISICEHKQFTADVTVNRLEDVGGFMAEVRIVCDQCRQQAQFIGSPIGIMPDRPTVNPDGTELRIPLRFDGSANPMFPGFVCKGAA